jgi:hypothetical protein
MLSTLIAILKHLELATRLHAAVPTLPPADAYAHAAAAIEASSPRVAPELLLAIAFVESRYDPTATSRIEGTTRRTGPYPSLAQPADLAPHGSLYCGPLQTYAASWRDCLAMRDLRIAYAAGASELETWLRDRRVQGDIVRALAGHGCGNFGVTTGRCNGYPARVRWIEHQLEHPGSGAAPTPS